MSLFISACIDHTWFLTLIASENGIHQNEVIISPNIIGIIIFIISLFNFVSKNEQMIIDPITNRYI